jgi:hypothetical protein
MNWRNGVRALAAVWAFAGAFFALIGVIMFLFANGYPIAAGLIMVAALSIIIGFIVATST